MTARTIHSNGNGYIDGNNDITMTTIIITIVREVATALYKGVRNLVIYTQPYKKYQTVGSGIIM